MERRLSTIFAADMVGFSRLMEADEIGTLERQKAHRQALIDPLFGKFHGRIIKEMGDGVLVEFSSVVDAVQCAVEIQRGMADREDTVPETQRIRYRIGINLGDIIADDGDIYGDGVNVAARLEQLAEPGGICISGTVYDHLRSQIDVGYESLGEVRVKNLNRTIRAYNVLTDGGPDAAPRSMAGRGRTESAAPGRRRTLILVAALVLVCVGGAFAYLRWPVDDMAQRRADPQGDGKAQWSIAVFPFSTLGPQGANSYLGQGVREDLIAELSAVPDLLVVTPASDGATDTGAGAPLKTARELGIAYALVGNVRENGGRIRFNMRLSDAASGASVWASVFDRDRDEVVSLSRDIAAEVVSALPGNIALPRRDDGQATPHFPDPEAYDLLLQGNVRFARFTPSEVRSARDYFRKAMEVDPDYARAYAITAFTLALEVAFGWSPDPERDLKMADELVVKALRLNPLTDQAYLARGLSLRSQRRYEEAIAAFQKAIELSPNSADGYSMVSLTYVFVGKSEKAVEAIDEAMLRNPDHPFFYLYTRGMALFHLERFEEAVEALKAALVKNPDFVPARLGLASAYAHLGRIDDAKWEYQEVLVRLPDFTILNEQARVPYLNSNDLLRYIDGLKIAAGQA